MKDISWILLSFGLATLVILLIKPSWNNKKNHSKIKINNKFVINNTQLPNKKSNQILSLRFSPKIKSNIPLDQITKLFLEYNLSFNNMQIFEKKDGKKTVFNVANLVEPGTFEDGKDIPGFTFFFQQSNSEADLNILNEMIEIMQELCKHYDGWILDDNGKNIDRSNLNKLLIFNK